MGKAGRWLRTFLSGNKDRPPQSVVEPPAAAPKEKRWSFRRLPVPAAQAADEAGRGGQDQGPAGAVVEFDQSKHAVAVAVAVATAAAADAAVAAAHAAASVARLSSRGLPLPLPTSCLVVEDAAAVRIQATFRGYLARTALCALRGIVKLQALVRGQLVRKQANATLRCMQALLAAQSHLRALHHHPTPTPPRPRQSPPQHRPRLHRRSYEMDRSCEDNAKIVEVDVGEPLRRSVARDSRHLLFADHHHHHHGRSELQLSPPREAYSGHLDDRSPSVSVTTACPSYMANTESSRAKARRSQSAPRQRTDTAALLERLPSRRKGTPPRAAVKMQRSSSGGAGAAARGGGHCYYSSSPWSALGGVGRLDVSTVSLKDSECGSTSSVLTAATTVYSRTRSLVGFEVRRGLYY